jgi:hypothetical protein
MLISNADNILHASLLGRVQGASCHFQLIDKIRNHLSFFTNSGSTMQRRLALFISRKHEVFHRVDAGRKLRKLCVFAVSGAALEKSSCGQQSRVFFREPTSRLNG